MQDTTSPSKGKNRNHKKGERINQEQVLAQLLEDHKKNIGDVVLVRIDARTTIELPASLSAEARQERIDNYRKNMSFKPAK